MKLAAMSLAFRPRASVARFKSLPIPGWQASPARLLAAAALLGLSANAMAQTSAYIQTNIISDGAVTAAQTDPTLINPWGISIGPQFWIDSPGSGLSLVENANGTKDFSVAVPPASSASPHGTPAGTVYNPAATSFLIPGGYAQFIFGTLDGTIAGWYPGAANAVTVVNNSSKSASYTDITLDQAANGTFLLAANFAAGTVDVFDSSFKPAQLTGGFVDGTIPAGYAPFGIHAIDGKVFVTYAQRNAQGRGNAGPGLGYVDVFDTSGNLIQSAISQGNLNAPWGMALAPAGFGSLAGDLLVGNFGDGVINAYDPSSFAFIGQVQDGTGKAIANPGLWEIVFGTNGVGDPNTLYFAAGINAEKDGLFGSIAIAQPAGGGGFSLQSSASSVSVTASQPGSATLSLASQNNFSGTVALSCSGLPANTACGFTPQSVNLATSGMQNVAVSISEVTSPANPNPYNAKDTVGGVGGAALALFAPVAGLTFIGVRRRSLLLRGVTAIAVVGCLFATIGGCSSYSKPATVTTPTSGGTAQTTKITVNATSGAITQSVPITVTFQ